MKQSKAGSRMRPTPIALVLAALVQLPSAANAFEIQTGNPDWAMRWDNTIRYNLGIRAQGQDQRVMNNTSYDDSDAKFGAGSIVTDRVDLLSEFDAVFQKRYGFRVSGAGWYDNAYSSTTDKTNPAFNVPGLGNVSAAYPNQQYSNFTKNWNRGPFGELMDAFVFGRFDAGSVPVDLRVGQQNVYWGESIFNFVDGVAYSQGPVDLRKLQTNPGTEVKEAFLPLNQIWAKAQLSDTLSLEGQYFLRWAPTRLPDGGTYLGAVDFLTLGGGTYVVNPAAAIAAALGVGAPPGSIAPVPFLGAPTTPGGTGDWGIRASWSPEFLDGRLGLYYRSYTDKLPQIVLGGLQPGLPVPVPSDVRLSYLKDNELYGVSLAKEVFGVSLGAEVAYRRNTGLLMGSATMVGQEPRGDTWHGVLNVLGTISKTPVFDSATYVAELNYSRLGKVTSNANNFDAVGYAGCPTNNKWDGCATNDAWGIALQFAPTWYQVFSGVNLSAPMFVQVGLSGNSPVLFGGYQDFGNYTAGISADIFSRYYVTLQYNGFLLHSSYGVNALGQPAVTSVNGIGDTSDRGWVSLTFKTTF